MAEIELIGKYYVYTLSYPDGKVFYVGKGTGDRIGDHERQAKRGTNSHKCSVIRKIWKDEGQVLIQKVAFFDNEKDAYRFEIDTITFLGMENLTNKANGGEGGARPGAGTPRRNVKLDRETALLIAHAKRKRTEENEGQVITGLLRELAFMVSNWQALSNHAEVFAPALLSNERWNGLKRDLEARTEVLGVDAFIDVVGERQRQQIEAQEE